MSGKGSGLVLFGAGRMGRLLFDQAGQAGFNIQAVVSRHRPDWSGDARWVERLEHLSQLPDLLIDFSLPAGARAAADWCAQAGVPLLSGTTGLNAGDQDALWAAAKQVPVMWAANYSIGLNLCLELVGKASAALDEIETLQITDVHHVHKQDAPSGTALELGRAAAPHEPVYDSIREGEITGFHEVRFQLAGESVSISHDAADRGIYARGALQAGQWLLSRRAGLYCAADWLRDEAD